MGQDQERQIESTGLASSSGKSKYNKRLALNYLRLFLVQLALISILSVLMMLKDFVTAYSVFLGGLIYLVPAGWFSLRVLVKNKAQTPRQIVANIYVSETGKVLLAVAMFTLVFMLVEPLNAGALFVTYILLQITGWYLQLKLNQRFLKL
ncbi:ATP synthase subunit I [Nitrincola schmidtii]|uniref:ATP synthase subunit I n=1 Tax=Nitrincola schmidtii TaxID=1730894 RepID=UPI00124DA6EC|nr:ATP synthase subunit I [Nitrincola schmidtii]